MPGGNEELDGGDLLLLEGQSQDLELLRGLQEVEIETSVPANVGSFESDRLTLLDATLHPRSALAGRTVGALNFRERYGIELAGIWREGQSIGAELADETLQIGDGLLLLGPRDRLQLLESDTDFLILSPLGQERPDTLRAPLAALIMFGVVLSVMLGYAPISIAAVVGGSLMVLTGCLNMETGVPRDRLACDFSDRRHAAAGHRNAGDRRRNLSCQPGDAAAWRRRAMASDYGDCMS